MRELRNAIADVVDAEARFTSTQLALLEHDRRRGTLQTFEACDRLETIYQRPNA